MLRLNQSDSLDRYIVPYFCITDYLKEQGYKEEDGATFISIVGAFNTIGMVVLGYIGDKPWLNVYKTYTICLISEYPQPMQRLPSKPAVNSLLFFYFSLRYIDGVNSAVCTQLHVSTDTRHDFRRNIFELILIYSDHFG